MSDWQMTHNNDIAYASWDFNSLATLLFVKQLVIANMKENIKLSFCEGNPPAMGSPRTEPPKFHSSDPQHATHLHLHCLFNSSFGQTWNKTSTLRFFCEEYPLGTNGDTTHWASHAETFNQTSTFRQQCEKHESNNTVPHYWSSVKESASEQWIHRTQDQQYKKHKSYNSKIITLVFVDIAHKTAGQSTVGIQAFYTINISNSFYQIYVY